MAFIDEKTKFSKGRQKKGKRFSSGKLAKYDPLKEFKKNRRPK